MRTRGIALNVASFVGATTVRQHELGEADVDPDPEQLDRMRGLVRQAMEEGALGVGSSLIYPPAIFAETDELVALTTEAAQCGGMYISHMRSEGDRLLESIDELIEISRRSGAPAEIYHLKQAGRANWGKLDAGDRQDRGRAGVGPQDHRRHVHLYRRRDRACRLDAAVGSGRRQRSDAGAPEGSRDRRADQAGDGAARQELGKSLPSRRSGRRPARQPDRAVAEAADRQDRRRGRQACAGSVPSRRSSTS